MEDRRLGLISAWIRMVASRSDAVLEEAIIVLREAFFL